VLFHGSQDFHAHPDTALTNRNGGMSAAHRQGFSQGADQPREGRRHDRYPPCPSGRTGRDRHGRRPGDLGGPGPKPITVYPAAYFADAQPYSAFDMLARLPGFDFDGGDSDVRGFSGATGNVLIDGQRPTGKSESLEAILRRIPARGSSASN
jgi:hypothetical protein